MGCARPGYTGALRSVPSGDPESARSTTAAEFVGQDAEVMTLRRRGTPALPEGERAAFRRLLGRSLFELIPLRDALERAEALPPRAATTVTASPTHGIESTIELCEGLIARGHPATPHLAAHMIRDRAHLAELLDRCVSARIRDVFAVGGDAKDRGEIHDAPALLRMMEELGHPFDSVGVAGYPEGHPSIPDEVLLSSLKEKQRYASYLTTQMSFDPDAIASWIARMRDVGVTLPVHLGLPGAVDLRRLLSVAARIGVGGSIRYLRKNRQLVRLLLRRSFTPERLLRSLAPMLADHEADVRLLHLFTFNQVSATVAWQEQMLAEIR